MPDRKKEDLGPLRDRIDEIDGRLVAALIERARVAQEVGRKKRELGIEEIYQPEREREILDRAIAKGHDPLPGVWLTRIFERIFAASRAIQAISFQQGQGHGGEAARAEAPTVRKMLASLLSGQSVSYLGPEGSYSHEAVKIMLKEIAQAKEGDAKRLNGVELMACKTPAKVVHALIAENCSAAILPIRNTTTGTLGDHLLLVNSEGLEVHYELEMPIRHCLWSKEGEMSLEDVGEIYAHPQAFEQCRDFLSTLAESGGYMGVGASNSSEALKKVGEAEAYSRHSDERDGRRRGRAAIAGPEAGECYGLKRIAKDIQDREDNATTFWLLTKQDMLPGLRPSQEKGRYRTHLFCYLPNYPGSLNKFTGLLLERKLDMSYIQSFCNSDEEFPFEHFFHVVIEAAFDHEELIEKADKLEMRVIHLATTVRQEYESANVSYSSRTPISDSDGP